jgi:ribosomal protein L11 methylase PrmA
MGTDIGMVDLGMAMDVLDLGTDTGDLASVMADQALGTVMAAPDLDIIKKL